MQISKGWLTSSFHIDLCLGVKWTCRNFRKPCLSFVFYFDFVNYLFVWMAYDEHIIFAYWYTDVPCWLNSAYYLMPLMLFFRLFFLRFIYLIKFLGFYNHWNCFEAGKWCIKFLSYTLKLMWTTSPLIIWCLAMRI